MASKQPNPNLWAVTYRLGKDLSDHESLWICAPNMKSAGDKGLRLARAKFHGTSVRITKVEWEGTIDAF